MGILAKKLLERRTLLWAHGLTLALALVRLWGRSVEHEFLWRWPIRQAVRGAARCGCITQRMNGAVSQREAQHRWAGRRSNRSINVASLLRRLLQRTRLRAFLMLRLLGNGYPCCCWRSQRGAVRSLRRRPKRGSCVYLLDRIGLRGLIWQRRWLSFFRFVGPLHATRAGEKRKQCTRTTARCLHRAGVQNCARALLIQPCL
mmetsp:Transcript_3705/g.6310  ORF Transcript_3705/g.6310 Transcript_3705/m.6310 type:complete len:202 (+) Transcript_3705:1024-1629(+)